MTRPRPSSLLVHVSWAAALCVVLMAAPAPLARRAGTWSPEAEQAIGTITQADLRAVIGFLASDALQGRATGHPGNDVAVRYVASLFQLGGVEPADAKAGYLVPLELVSPSLGPDNALTVKDRDGSADVVVKHRAGEHVQPYAASPSREVTAGLAFAGYGISAPDLGYDDYAGLDVKGRVVLVFDRAPEGTPLARDPYDRSSVESKSRAARSRGAVGLLVVAPTGNRRLRDLARVFPESPSPRERSFRLADDVLALPSVRVSGTVASALVAGGARKTSLDALRDAADEAAKAAGRTTDSPKATASRGFVVPDRTVTVSVDVRATPVRAFNVVGRVGGTDLASDAVVVGAHLDHDGLDAEGRIYNGADDNASGTAGVLEVASAFAAAVRAGSRPRRTVVFGLWNGEERGLLGARWFAAHPVPEGARVVANLNLDMIGRDEDVPAGAPNMEGMTPTRAGENTNSLHVLGYSRSPGLAALAREENERVGLTLKTDLDEGPQRLIQRSDQWPFLERRIPALFFFTGLHPDYHTPQDDLERINFAKMEKIVRLAYRVAWRLATEPSVPAYADPPPSNEH